MPLSYDSQFENLITADLVATMNSKTAELVVATTTTILCLLILLARGNGNLNRELPKRKQLLLILELLAKENADSPAKELTHPTKRAHWGDADALASQIWSDTSR